MSMPIFSRLRPWLAGLLLAAPLALALGSCHQSSPDPTPTTPAPNVQLRTISSVGPVLTDSVGNTLYAFALDVDGANTCTSATCNPMWPVYYGGPIRVPAGLAASDFTSRKTTDGRAQTYYKGWPLYYYAPPANGVYTREPAGVAGGNGLGGVWAALNPGFGVMLGRKSVMDKTTSASTTKTYLVDAQGRTLYYFAKDDAFPNTQPTNCTGGCLSVWPALVGSAPAIPTMLRNSDFATITRPDGGGNGSQQLTYKGRPLYYFAADNTTRGRVEGDHLSSYGDYWYVATP